VGGVTFAPFISSPNAGEVYLNVGNERIRLSRGALRNLVADGLREDQRWPDALAMPDRSEPTGDTLLVSARAASIASSMRGE
jgi:hypothetical protein